MNKQTIHLDLMRVYTGILVLIAAGSLTKIAPDQWKPYVAVAGALVLLFHNSPIKTPQEAIADFQVALRDVLPILPARVQLGASEVLDGLNAAAPLASVAISEGKAIGTTIQQAEQQARVNEVASEVTPVVGSVTPSNL